MAGFRGSGPCSCPSCPQWTGFTQAFSVCALAEGRTEDEEDEEEDEEASLSRPPGGRQSQAGGRRRHRRGWGIEVAPG